MEAIKALMKNLLRTTFTPETHSRVKNTCAPMWSEADNTLEASPSGIPLEIWEPPNRRKSFLSRKRYGKGPEPCQSRFTENSSKETRVTVSQQVRNTIKTPLNRVTEPKNGSI